MSIAMSASRPAAIVARGTVLAVLSLPVALSGPVLAQSLTLPAPAAAPTAMAETAADTVLVKVDHAKVVRLPAKAQTVIVGNPAIADVTVQRNGVMIVTGKSYGVTNLIALDAAGVLLAESLVSVAAASDSLLTVQRGLQRESYSCTPTCQPAAQPGDSKGFFDEIGGQTKARNAAATGGDGK